MKTCWTTLGVLLLGGTPLSGGGARGGVGGKYPVGGVAKATGTAPKRADVAPPSRAAYDRDVRPILAENCFTCHGMDASKRMAGLRLDDPAVALKPLPSGRTAIVPGKPAESELVGRITAKDGSHMPPAYSGKQLTPAQAAVLIRWIAEGAHYAPHWAFVAPRRPPLPAVRDKAWPRNAIDYFVLARLEQENLHPSPEADRRTLIRRLSFDLTGLPPTIAEVNAFLADDAPDAYDRLVNRLLDSPHYGERMALRWLDLSRYADTHGFHIDSGRDMWRWRDWVIDAYNRNMPYDRFTVEQIAGDLLPNATLDQKVATGFNRNHPITFEGGAIPEEYQCAYVLDRVNTTATTFMGLTMRCAQCHDHKYDPITQKEFYQFYAFFNTIAEQGTDGQQGNAAPLIQAPYPGQEAQLRAYSQKIADLEDQRKDRAAKAASDQAKWESDALALLAKTPPVSVGLAARYRLDEGQGTAVADTAGNAPSGTIKGKVSWAKGRADTALEFDGDTHIDIGPAAGFDRTDAFSYGAWVYPTSTDSMAVVSRMDDAASYRGWDLLLNDGKVYAHLIHDWDKDALRVAAKEPIPTGRWTHLFVTYDGSGKAKGVALYVDGKPVEVEATNDTLSGTIRTDQPLRIGSRGASASFKGRIADVRIYGRALKPAEVAQLAGPDSIRDLLAAPADKRTDEQKAALAGYYLENVDEPYRKLTDELDDWRRKDKELEDSIPTTMVMQEMDKPRETHILLRGQYDKPGDKVEPGVPAIFPPLPKGAPCNRLGLAEWLVDPSNPLTARVAVNRFWEMYFGTGLVKTSEDFGTQGEPPSHPELVDWLATEFIRTGWDVKAMQRLIVTSATYRQASRATPELLDKDPENRLLARGPRFRLPAESIRDEALALSGLLVDQIGGPSVKPYQPSGLWEEIAFGGGFSEQSYQQDHGDALYRRSMYTFWKRTCPPPMLELFDAPDREFCLARRSITDTPLQALALMNDPTFVEASRKLAERMMTEASDSPYRRIDLAFRLATARPVTEDEFKVLMGIYNQQWAAFKKDPSAAEKLLAVGESKRDAKLDPIELAAWTSVASVILNLDETITKS